MNLLFIPFFIVYKIPFVPSFTPLGEKTHKVDFFVFCGKIEAGHVLLI